MRLSELLRPGCARIPLRATTPTDAIDELCTAIAKSYNLPRPEVLSQDVQKRESDADTILLPGIAFPHAKNALVSSRSIAVGRFHTPVQWVQHNPDLVRHVF